MRPYRIIVFILMCLSLLSCMKRTTIGRIQDGTDNNDASVIQPNYGDPSVGSPECPNGVSFSVVPVPNATYRVNETATFIVTASGCRFGYRLSYGSENKPFGSATTVPGTVFTTTFPKTFTVAQSQVVSARLSVLGQNGLSTREFPMSFGVVVNEAVPLNCPDSDFMIPRGVSENYTYSFNLQPTRPAKIISVTGGESDFVVASPTFSSTLSQTISGNITVKARNGSLRFAIQDANAVNGFCSVSLRKDIFGVTLDFNGDRLLDDAALIRLFDNTYQLQISYTQQAGATKINSIISANGFLASENYEWMIAGDINQDNRPDLIFFRKEGSPAVGKFKLALSRGGTVGGTDLSYDFLSLGGQWANDRLLTNPRLDTSANPPKMIGWLNGQSYTSVIQNNSVANPVPSVLRAEIAATPNPVALGQQTTVLFITEGYSYCNLSYCSVNSQNQCVRPEIFMGGISSNYRLGQVSYNLTLSQGNTKVMSSCRAPDFSMHNRELVISVSNPPVPSPLCQLSVTRQGKTAVCDVKVTVSGGAVNPGLAPHFSVGSIRSGSWNTQETRWSGTANCSMTANSSFMASLTGPGGTSVCSPNSVIVPLVNRWVATHGVQCGTVCAQAGMASVPYLDGNYCASGEVRPAGVPISYPNGTWGSGTEFTNGQSTDGYCYGSKPGKNQKRDNDRTDITVACFCRN